MSDIDIRWQQRLQSYQKALRQLTKFVEKGDLNELEEQGYIKAFEYTYELAWTLIKDYFAYQGIESIHGSRDAIRAAFNQNLVEDGEGWMAMIKARNLTSHIYNLEIIEDISTKITERFYGLFIQLAVKMEAIQNEQSRG